MTSLSRFLLNSNTLDPDHLHQIQSLLDRFPFQHLHHSMTTLNWIWPRLGRVPTIQELHQTAEELLLRVAATPQHDRTTTYCQGGLRASRFSPDPLHDTPTHTTVFALDIDHALQTPCQS